MMMTTRCFADWPWFPGSELLYATLLQLDGVFITFDVDRFFVIPRILQAFFDTTGKALLALMV